MFACFLLLRQAAGPKWVPLFAVPFVIAWGLASVGLMLSGIKGLLTARRRPNARPHRHPTLLSLR